MEKSVEQDASAYASDNERRITRSKTKSGIELQAAVLDRNNQVVRKKIKSGKEIRIPFFPEEIVFNILLFLPAKVLWDVMKLVCRLWCRVIRNPVFIQEHFSQPHYNSPFLVVSYYDYFELHYINKDETTWNLVRKIDQRYLAHGVGLILFIDRDDPSILYLLNPSTNQIVRLPKIHVRYLESPQNWAVAYSPSTSRFIVSCTSDCCSKVYLLTVGVDNEWRNIVVKPYNKSCIDNRYTFSTMNGTCGFIHWYQFYKQCIIVLDLEKEILYEVGFPKDLEVIVWFLSNAPVSSNRIVILGLERKRKCLHFWELVDYKNGGKWRKVGSLDSESILSKFKKIMGLHNVVEIEKKIRPVVVIKGEDEVIFKLNYYKSFFAYDFKTGTVSWVFDSVPKPRVFTESSLKSLVFSNTLLGASN